MGCIYQAVNVATGQCYIGATTRALARRRKAHGDHAAAGSVTPFHAAIREVGLTGFEWSVVEDDLHGDAIFAAEVATIKSRRERGDLLYNVTNGGRGSSGFTPAMHESIGLAQQGREPPNRGVPHTSETKAKISASKLGRPPWNKGKSHPHTRPRGIKHSEETKRKMSETRQRMAQERAAQEM